MTTTTTTTTTPSLATLLVAIATLWTHGVSTTKNADLVANLRCHIVCHGNSNQTTCLDYCLDGESPTWQKMGQCPSVITDFDAACLHACFHDTGCPRTEKCCRHSCGKTCQKATGLELETGLPPIPVDVKVTEGNRRRTVIVKWQLPSDSKQPVLYLLEERHHSGANFNEEALTDWGPCQSTPSLPDYDNTTNRVLKNWAKPGYWYQFRVSAVNENGTRGFSEGSNIYTPNFGPRQPSAPENVTVNLLPDWRNGSLMTAEVKWLPPLHSDLPVQKYKIFWSRRLRGASRPLDSVFVNQRVVSKDRTRVLLKDLQPNTSYFIQVQALVQFGKKRLKGELSGLAFNTTASSEFDGSSDELQLQKLFLYRNDLRARIYWKIASGGNRRHKLQKYTVSWWSPSCSNLNKSAKTTHSKSSHFDISGLKYDCKIRVNVRSTYGKASQSLVFKTPTCEEFKSSSSRKIHCM